MFPKDVCFEGAVIVGHDPEQKFTRHFNAFVPGCSESVGIGGTAPGKEIPKDTERSVQFVCCGQVAMLHSEEECMFFEVRQEPDVISSQLGQGFDAEIKRSMVKLFSAGYG